MLRRLLDEIRDIRESIDATERHPVITRIREEGDTLYIECEDRADKSIVIGTGGWVVGKLASRLGYARITVSSRLDAIMRARMRLASRRMLPGWASHMRSFLEHYVQGMTPPAVPAVVMGEELLWACGLLESLGGSPFMVHTGFVDEHVKAAYPHTTFVKCEAPVTSYSARRERLTLVSIDIADREGIDVVFGLFENPVEERNEKLLIDPQRFLSLTSWECSRYEQRRFRPRIHALSDENRALYVHRVLRDVYDGLMEPTRASRAVFDHWTPAIAPCDERDGPAPALVRYRRANALRRAGGVSAAIHDALRAYGHLDDPQPDRGTALVAWSGGTDSTACLGIASAMGFSVEAVTVRTPGIDEEALLERARRDGIKATMIEPCEDIEAVFDASCQGRIHPCGRCHGIITSSVEAYARDEGVPIVIYGDMISTGAQSIVEDAGLILLNLPAALALTKRQLALYVGAEPSEQFGCPHLRLINHAFAYAKKISLQRVLRELRAQAIDRQYALKLIKDIMD